MLAQPFEQKLLQEKKTKRDQTKNKKREGEEEKTKKRDDAMICLVVGEEEWSLQILQR